MMAKPEQLNILLHEIQQWLAEERTYAKSASLGIQAILLTKIPKSDKRHQRL